MKIPEFSVNRKVTTAMLAMILIVLGLLSFTRLGLDFFPDIEFPTVSVVTTYTGASSGDIENTITRPMEQIINSVSRVKKVTSTTLEGASIIMVEFEWGTNLDFAAQDIRDQIGLYQNFMPEEASDPLVVKFNLGQMPIIFGGITSKMPTYELKELIEDEVTPRLERIDGVASAQVFSMDTREIWVDIDKAALESLNVSLDQILFALRMENLNLPAGRVVERHSEFLLRTLGEFKNLDDIRNTIIGSTQTGQLVYLSDVADVKDTMKDSRFIARVQGEKGVFYFISKRSGANTVITAQAVNKELAKIRETLPPDIKFFPFMDQAEMIQRVIRRTGNNALIGGILAMFFIFVFLRNWRPTVTIFLAIPLSVITTFIALYLAGYTINLLTLGGLALGIGMLVDNAVVVIENIFRHIEEGKNKEEAAKIGASEVGMAITASTLTTIAVFFPMVFAQGVTGKMTRGLALAIAFSLLASLFVALTVVPMVASLLFKANSKQGVGEKSKRTKQFAKARNFYRRILHRALRSRGWVLGGAFGLLVISFVIVPFLGTEFMPTMDREMIIFTVKMPVGTSLEETNRVVSLVENLMKLEPGVETVSAQVGSQAEENPADMAGGFSTTGSHEGMLWASLVDLRERDLSDMEILERIRGKLPKLKDVKFEALDMGQAMMGGAQSPIEIKIFGKDLDLLKEVADNIVLRIQDVEGLRDVTHSLAEGKPEYHITVNREKASRMGLMVSQVANSIQTAALGKVATRFREGNEEIDIRVRFKEKFRDSLDDIKNIPIKTSLNTMVRLGQVASISKGEGPIQITRENQARAITVSANITGRDLGSIVKDIKERIDDIERGLPPGYFTEFGGQYEQMQEAFIIMAGAFALATLLVYMIMASQFESFRHPFVIMFTIPLAIIGVILALLLTGRPVSLPVLIGFIMLGGIAVNNGIVLVDYINQLKRKGVEIKEAILQACSVRLRPVLITAFTTVLGMMPMALSVSEGAEMRAPMAITVVGGLVATTFLTLFVIPIIYSFFDRVNYKEKII
ncbi:MAG: efflux RND transporter permease subunit [Candidatus Aminicenantes bacterium]|nr:efflux RND transporter permease subunit [Candidatus Aminicenantes bacterium]